MPQTLKLLIVLGFEEQWIVSLLQKAQMSMALRLL
jgi:hypothetical protein